MGPRKETGAVGTSTCLADGHGRGDGVRHQDRDKRSPGRMPGLLAKSSTASGWRMLAGSSSRARSATPRSCREDHGRRRKRSHGPSPANVDQAACVRTGRPFVQMPSSGTLELIMNKLPIKIATVQSQISPDVRENGRQIRRLMQRCRSPTVAVVLVEHECVRGHSPMDGHWCVRLRTLASLHSAQPNPEVDPIV